MAAVVEILASGLVVVDAAVLVVLAVLAELLEVDDIDELVLDTPIVAAIDTPSFSSQHVLFPPWQHQVPSPQSVTATFCVGSPFSCPTTRVSPQSNTTRPMPVFDVSESAYRVLSTQVRQAIRALPGRIRAAPAPIQWRTLVRVQTQSIGLTRVWLDYAVCPVRPTAHGRGVHDLVAGLEGRVGDRRAIGVVACCLDSPAK